MRNKNLTILFFLGKLVIYDEFGFKLGTISLDMKGFDEIARKKYLEKI